MNHPLIKLIQDAQEKHPILPAVLHQALHIGLSLMDEGKEQWLEENKEKRHIVEPHLWHRLMGEAKEMFDSLDEQK